MYGGGATGVCRDRGQHPVCNNCYLQKCLYHMTMKFQE